MSDKDFKILQNKLKVQDTAIKHLIRAIEPKDLEKTKHRDFALALILNEIEPTADIDEYFDKQCKERYLKNA